MTRILLAGIIVFTFLFKSFSQTPQYIFSGWYTSLISEKWHTSEGLLLNIGGDTLINIFRIDSTNTHVSNTSFIASRFSYDKGISWTSPGVVYNSVYDDRNIIGGILEGGRIVLIFRRFDADKLITKDMGRIYSDNKGISWSTYSGIFSHGLDQPFGGLVKGSDGFYHVQINGPGTANMYKSLDGSEWTFQSIISNTIPDLSETSIAYIGKNRMIALARQEKDSNSSYYMLRSDNNGDNWQYVGRSGLNRNKTYVNRTAPFVTWDSIHNSVIAISTERNHYDALNDSIHIYFVPPDSAYHNQWKQKLGTLRPVPEPTITYGYPSLAQLSAGNWVGIFTEIRELDIPEFADLYQFDLNFLPGDLTGCNSGPPVPIVNITSSANRICENTATRFNAINVGGGLTSFYQWKVNGINVGSNNPVFTTNNLKNNDIISCIMVNNDKCYISDKGISNRIKIKVDTLPKLGFSKDTTLCQDSTRVLDPGIKYASILWSNGTNSPQLFVKELGKYWARVTDSHGCIGTDTAFVAIKILCPRKIYFPTVFTPNQDGINDVFKPGFYGNLIRYNVSVYNKWGQRVFFSANPRTGWDGSHKLQTLNNDLFVWTCSYQFEGGVEKYEKGTVFIVK